MDNTIHKSRITVDLASVDLYRSLKFAAVAKDVPVREIVVEAIEDWLEKHRDLLKIEFGPPSLHGRRDAEVAVKV